MTEIPESVDDWLDELTATQLDDVAQLLQRRAEDKRRREWQTDDTEARGRSEWQWRADDSTVTSKYNCPVNQI